MKLFFSSNRCVINDEELFAKWITEFITITLKNAPTRIKTGWIFFTNRTNFQIKSTNRYTVTRALCFFNKIARFDVILTWFRHFDSSPVPLNGLSYVKAGVGVPLAASFEVYKGCVAVQMMHVIRVFLRKRIHVRVL